MSTKTNEINYYDFKNICRTCLFNCELKPLQDNLIILEVLHKLIGVDFETSDALPQQICLNCFEKIHEIHEFSLRCKQTHSRLIKCLNNIKNNEITNKYEIPGIKQEVFDEDEIKTKPDSVQPFEEVILVPNSSIKLENEELNRKEVNENPADQTQISKQRNRKTYKCDICSKTFKYSTSYKRHKTVHSGERPFECDICSKVFKEPSNLVKHKKIHSGERPYQCDICNKTFSDTCNLDIHKRTHVSERPYECDVCGKSFKRLGVLILHKRIHSGERPAQCDVCNKTFKDSSNLATHKKTHSSERPYECDVCPKTFKLLGDLMRHKRIHSGERPYKCEFCKKAFIESGALSKHKANIHFQKNKIK